jgi:hypothetical protein
MKKVNQKIIFAAVAILLSACSKTEFADVSQSIQTKTEIPQDPTPISIPTPVTPVVPPSTAFKLSNGVCNQDSSTNVLSCLKCQVPQILQPPQLSVKAQALADSMFLACQIPNKSDLTQFRPTKEMIINKINRGSVALYPETPRTAQMALVIAGLTNVNDSSLRQKMFGGLWYQPPYSDAFETYFGLTVQEAKSTFCWDGNVQTPQITGVSGLYSKQYIECQYGIDPFNCKEIPSYVAAIAYRNQFQNVLSVSISQPYLAPIPDPQKKCSWDKFEGDNLIEAKKILKKWKSEGRKLAMEFKNASGAGQCGLADEANLNAPTTVSIAGYVCH